MNYTTLKNTLLILLCLIAADLKAANDSDTLTLEFPQGKSAIYPDFKDNDSKLRRLRRAAESIGSPDSLSALRHISVIGAASPEGSVAINERLSRLRADNIFDYLSKYSKTYPLPDSITTFTFLGRDWSGLLNLVEQDPAVPYREETINTIKGILANHPNTPDSHNLERIKELRGGEPYRYMYTHLFPELRKSSIILETYPLTPKIYAPDFQAAVEIVPIIGEVTAVDSYATLCKRCTKPFYMDLRTNLLFDALILPNIGVEFYLGKNWSIIGNWMYGWWDKDNIHRYWRAYGGDIGVRYWFGSKAHQKPLTGHHIGIYGGVLTYDFEFGGKGYMGGKPSHSLWDRCNYLGGVEYGYSLPIARRLNLDFTIGLGYMGGKLLEYEPEDGHYVWQKTKRLNWVGPTKAEISLVWLIGCDNVNSK